MKPLSRILVINDEHLVLREFVKGLNAAARTLDNPLGITFAALSLSPAATALVTFFIAVRTAVRRLMLCTRSLAD